MLTDPMAAGLSRGITLRIRLLRPEEPVADQSPAPPRRPWRRLGLGLAGLGLNLAGLGLSLTGLGRRMAALGERLAAEPPSSARSC
ncbi:hypothetical protein [Labrys wisconsinensis]|uniref:Uncharacterized protein n=1 Tax=Labrys wisconsinensis TaxID=425677 RepID=A0ABU0JF76_9HYPH|nr:hypothetical protein [Labrys wisconsinensis]MDQ0472928.1 hypothetical protein [Labrys wisconsinensis]